MKLFRDQIKDEFARINFDTLEGYVREENILASTFKFFTSTLTANAYPATIRFYHNLKFVPKDILTTSIIGGTLTWGYDSATKDYIEATISAPVTFRAFMGSYSGGRI